MNFEQVRWTEFKSFVDARSPSIQFRETADFYFMKVADQWFGLECNLHKTEDAADVTVFEATYKALGNKQVANVASPFASKVFAGKKLYKRVHGIKQAMIVGDTDVVFPCPYNWAKITTVELIGGETGDTVSFYVLDKAVNPLYGVPNAVLNQFGFTVNVAKDYYEHKSEFDADIYLNLQLKATYNSVSAKTVGLNFILNEVK